MTFPKRHSTQPNGTHPNPSKLLHGDCLKLLRTLEAGSVDLICTDPPYGIGFLGHEWDTFQPAAVARDVAASKRKCGDDEGFANPALSAARYDHSPQGGRRFRDWFRDVSAELLRVLKPGAFAFVCIGARQDSVSAVIAALTEAGFKTDFTSLYWTYASGFPKALNIGKALGKRAGAKRVAIGRRYGHGLGGGGYGARAKVLHGSYGGFQPKPAVEVIVIAMKPLAEKTYADQALKNGKGVTWLDDCRIPSREKSQTQGAYAGKTAVPLAASRAGGKEYPEALGRFPANLLVSDDALNDGRSYKGTRTLNRHRGGMRPFGGGAGGTYERIPGPGDTGSYSRFFSLDAWAGRTLPFLIAAKASKREKNLVVRPRRPGEPDRFCAADRQRRKLSGNTHPTVKPLKLMAYLVTLGSRPGDLVLDPFLGSGTTAVAAKLLGRRYLGIERERKYFAIAKRRIAAATAPICANGQKTAMRNDTTGC